MVGKLAKSRIPAPKSTFQKLVERTFLLDVVLVLFGVLGTAASAIRAYCGDKPSDAWAGHLYLAGCIGILIFTAVKLSIQWSKHDDGESVHDLEAVLVALHTQLQLAIPLEARGNNWRIRLTIHIPHANNTELIQAINYIGDERQNGGVGRTFDIRAGIIGRAIKEGKPIVANRETQQVREYYQDLHENWGFSEEEAKKRDPDAMCWVAVPTGTPMEGILYGDSTEKGFFSDPVALQLLGYFTVAIAKYLDLRFPVKS